MSAADLRVTHALAGPAVRPRSAEPRPAPRRGRRPRLGLLVPVVWIGSGPAPGLVVVRDHVDLSLRGPLTGRRPDGGPQVVPVAGRHISTARRRSPAADGRVYSEVAVAGVADAGRLTPFERRRARVSGVSRGLRLLVDAVVVAAFHGFDVVACGVPRGEATALTTNAAGARRRDRSDQEEGFDGRSRHQRHRAGAAGRAAHRVGRHADAGPGLHPRALRAREAAHRHPRGRLPARHLRDGQPHAHARRRAAPTWCSAPPTR